MFTKYLAVLVASCFFCLSLQAQDFKEKLSKDGVIFEYKPSDKEKTKNDALEMMLVVKNTNKYPVKVSFSVEYLVKNELQEAMDKTTVCLSRKGFPTAKQTIYLTTQSLAATSLQNPDFSWKIEDLAIRKVDGCK